MKLNHDVESDWMTAAEAADYLKVRTRTFLAWVRQGHVKGYALHGVKRRVWRFRKSDLDLAMGFVATSVSSSAVLNNSGGLQ